MQDALTVWRLKWYPRSILFALLAGFIITVVSGEGVATLTGRLGGDFPAFYGAGRLIAQGEGGNLYNPSWQSRMQKDLFPERSTGYLPFSYPPFVALFYAPLSLLDYRIAYVLHTLLMVVALALAIHLMRPANKLIDRHYTCALALALTFYPMFSAVFGAQNTAVSLLLVLSAWRSVGAGREWLAGMMLGLLLFKPQFAIPLIGLHLLQGRWRTGLGSLFVAGILYSVSAWVSGLHWIMDWMKHSWWFYHTDATVSFANSVSWLGFLEAVLGSHNPSAAVVGWGMTLLTALVISWVWLRGGRGAEPALLFGAAMPALVLMPPHAMYYDLGLLIPTYSVLIAADVEDKGFLIGFIWLLSFSQTLGSFLGFSPLFFLLLVTSVLAVPILKPVLDKRSERG